MQEVNATADNGAGGGGASAVGGNAPGSPAAGAGGNGSANSITGFSSYIRRRWRRWSLSNWWNSEGLVDLAEEEQAEDQMHQQMESRNS
jgi:hypothetical protein